MKNTDEAMYELTCAVYRESFFNKTGMGCDGFECHDGDKFYCYSENGPAGILQDFGGNVIESIYDNVVFKPRKLLELDLRYLQLIPYNVFFCGFNDNGGVVDGDDFIFVCRRSCNGGDKRLSGKDSVGIGGHISVIDFYGDFVGRIDIHGVDTYTYGAGKFLNMIKANMAREIKEEVGLTPQYYKVVETPGFIFDWSNDVGMVHLGILNFIRVNDVSEVFLSKEHSRGEFKSLKKLFNDLDVFSFESWSDIVLSFLSKRINGEGSDGSRI